jgi:hypothetical protein
MTVFQAFSREVWPEENIFERFKMPANLEWRKLTGNEKLHHKPVVQKIGQVKIYFLFYLKIACVNNS